MGQGYRTHLRCNNENCQVHYPSSPGKKQEQAGDPQHSDSCSDDTDAWIQGSRARAPEAGQHPHPSPTVREPIAGELYQAWWTSDHSWYPVTVLPWGDLAEVGLRGSLNETDLFKEKLPTCFAVENTQEHGLRIVGWKKDFELRGRRASERKFPCMFFEGISAVLPRDDKHPRPVQNLAWVMGKHLRPIHYRHSDGHFLNRAGLDEAKAFRERVVMLKTEATEEQAQFSPLITDYDSDGAGAREEVSSCAPNP